MANIFYAVPAPPPAPPVNPWPGVSMSWTGTDGSRWALTDRNSGVRLAPGTRGFSNSPRDRHVSVTAGAHGSRYRGSRAPESKMFWVLDVYRDGGTQEWLDYDSAWWASLNPRKTGVFRVTQPSGVWRERTLRLDDDGDADWLLTPGLVGWQHYGIYLVAEDPFWYGPEITSPLWKAADPQDFIDAEDLAPPFHPGSVTTVATAQLTNPGDESAWPTWTAVGPVDGVSISLDGHEVSYGELLEGQTLVINTDPRVQTAWLNGVDVTGDLDSYDFAPIPAGETVDVAIEMVGAGTLQASYRPRHDRAW